MRGFRTPALMVSPRARRGTSSHQVYDHTSVLKMIEWRWGLEPLTPRDAAARNMAEVLDFGRAPEPARAALGGAAGGQRALRARGHRGLRGLADARGDGAALGWRVGGVV